MFYEADETDEFEAAKELLVRRCTAWPGAGGLTVNAWLLDTAIEYRHSTVDGRLGFWTPRHVRTFLLALVAGQIAAPPAELLAAPDTLRCLLGYLSAHEMLDPRGATLEHNVAAIDATEPEFQQAIADSDRFSVGKRLALAAIEQGIDLNDPHALQDPNLLASLLPDSDPLVLYSETFDAELEAELDAERMPSHPPITLPGDDALAATAAATPVVRQLRALYESPAGTGPADWAKLVRIVRTLKGRLVPVARAKRLVEDPLALWQRAFETLPDLLRLAYFDSYEVVPDVLNTLYGMPEPMPLIRLRIPIRHGITEYFTHDVDDEALDADIDVLLDLLTELGAIEVTQGRAHEMYTFDLNENGPWEPDEIRLIRDQLSRPGRLLRLTDLGAWGVRTGLLASGREAALVGELAGVSAAELLNVLVDHYTRETAPAEIAGWLAAHDDDRDALVDAIRGCPFRNRAGAMLHVLTGALPDGRMLLRRLRTDPALAPAALSQLVDEGALHIEDVTEAEGRLAMAEGFLRLLEVAGVERTRELIVEQAGGDVGRLLDTVLESGHPDTAAMADFRTQVADELRPPARTHRLRLASHHDRPPTRPGHRRPRR